MIGQTISHYRILEKLGAGGMGVVYKAEDTKLKRTVALKFLPAHLSASEGNKDRFIHEAQAASALNHPNVCTIHDIQEHDGQLFIVMEFVDGVTLWDKIQESPMSVADALSWAIQIGEALQEAHSKGIVHRDMKSENIIINAKFRAKVMDFGLAQLKGSIHAAQTGTVQGTLLYMSPEQARGDDVVFATDIWSLGVVLYEMLTTKFPFYHEYETAILYSILNEPPIPPKEIRSDIPEELDRIIIKCLQKEWQRRYPSAMNLVSDLRKLARALESGTPVVPAKRRRTTESALDVERKPATVMLVSIGHYAEMAGLLEPEELADLLEKCLAAVKAVAEKYLGTMASVTGGRFTMIFGLPEAIEGAARNAVQAAVDVRTALQRIAEEKQQQRYLTPTVSIDTGLVIAGPFGAAEGKEYAVVGDPMELVVKLLEAAQPGGILVGPLTQKQTQDSFKYRKGKSVVFRGGRAPVPSYELVGTIRKTERGRMGTERMLASMYVGREPELNKLELHVLKAIQGEGSIVSILGEPGIGKTRLIAELRNREPLKRVTVMEGRAVSHGQNLSFHPIIDIVKRWIGAEEEDTEEQLQRRLLDAVSSLAPDTVDEVFPFVATLMGMRLGGKHAERLKGVAGDAMMNLIQKAMRELILKAAARRPIVFIIEDLHWADQSSIALLQSLFRLVQSQPILFINVLRPHYEETGDRLMSTVRERYPGLAVEIEIEPLKAGDCRQLIRNLVKVGNIPQSVEETILSRSEGNPFFIEEVISTFIDEGAIELRDGQFTVTDKIERVIIPESIQQVLLSRIDKLPDDTKFLLKIASVIGRSFFHRVLIEVAKDIEDLHERLEHLKEIQMIRENTRLDELEFTFKHALVQEVAYESIPANKRKDFHRIVAEVIERVFAARIHEFYGMLALHYSNADEKEKAEEFLVKAGEATLNSAASHEALSFFQEAMKLYTHKYGKAADANKIAMFEKNIGLALFNKGLLVDAVQHLDRALEAMGDRVPTSKPMVLLAAVRDFAGLVSELYRPVNRKKLPLTPRDELVFQLRWKRANALANFDPKRFFVDLLGTIHMRSKFALSDPESSQIYFLGGSLMTFSGISLSLARKFMDRACMFPTEADPRMSLALHSSQCLYFYHSGEWNHPPPYDEDLLRTNLRLGELYPTMFYLSYYLYFGVGKGEFSLAEKYIETMRDIGETYEVEYGRLYAWTFEAYIQLNKHHGQEALRHISTCTEYTNKIRLETWNVGFAGQKARAHIMLNDLAAAEHSLREGEEIHARLGQIAGIFTMNLSIARQQYDVLVLEAFLQGRKESAGISGHSALVKQAQTSMKSALKQFAKLSEFRPEAYRYAGTLHWLLDKKSDAVQWWKKSIDAATSMGKRQELGRTYCEVGKRLLMDNNGAREVDGHPGKYFIGLAGDIFREMQLDEDVKDLNIITA